MIKEPVILKSKLIESPEEFCNLDIIDFNRFEFSLWEDIKLISPYFVNAAAYTIIKCDMSQAPEREDFPGWKHGRRGLEQNENTRLNAHELASIEFWNWFHWRKLGELHLSDAPDFWGYFTFPDGRLRNRFWGDFGKISSRSFIYIAWQLHIHDLWISIDGDQHTIIEPLIDLATISNDAMKKMFDGFNQRPPEPVSIPTKNSTLNQFLLPGLSREVQA